MQNVHLVVVSLCIVPMHPFHWFQKTFAEMLRNNFNAQNSLVASFSFYKMHSFHKTWNLFPLNLHSLPLHGCLPFTPVQHQPRPRCSCPRRRSSLFLGAKWADMTMKPVTFLPRSQPALRPSAVWSCHFVCLSALFCFYFFFSQHADESRCGEGGLSISACRVKRVDAVC